MKVPLHERSKTLNCALLWCDFLKGNVERVQLSIYGGFTAEASLHPGRLSEAPKRCYLMWKQGGRPQDVCRVSERQKVESRLLRTASFYRTGSSLETPVIAPSRGSAEEVSEQPHSHNRGCAAAFHPDKRTGPKINVKGPREQFRLPTTRNKLLQLHHFLSQQSQFIYFFLCISSKG